MGIAASLSLCRSQWRTTLVLRDRTCCDLANADKQLRAFSPPLTFDLPPTLQVVDGVTHKTAAEDAIRAAQVVFVCVPSSAVPNVAPLVCTAPQEASVVVCSRGLSSKGETPHDMLLEAATAASRHPHGTAGPRIVTSTGALFAKELAVTSNPPTSASFLSPVTFGLSRKPFVASHDGHRSAAAPYTELFSGRDAPRCCFADSSDADATIGKERPLVEQLAGLANGLSLFVSVGAGLVSNQFPGSVSAQFSYHLHALQAVSQVLHVVASEVGDRGRATSDSANDDDTPPRRDDVPTGDADVHVLPPLLASTITAACFNLGSREFAYGRTLDFNFTQKYSMNAHFRRGCMHQQSLRDTCDGIFALLVKFNISSPFFTSLCDAFLCFHRGSIVGQHLVNVGEYSWLDALSQSSPLVGHMKALDKAVLHDEAIAFEHAKARLVEVLNQSPHPSSS